MKTKSDTPHYYVGNNLFISWADAEAFCDANKIPYSRIEKTYTYR